MERFSVEVRGILPEPWTSPEGSISRRNGKLFVQMHKAEKTATFQAALHDALEQEFGDHMLDPFPDDGCTWMRIWVWRELNPPGASPAGGRERTRPDATNLQKAIEDACQGVLFTNDRDNLHVACTIMEQGDATTSRIIIEMTHTAQLPEPPQPDFVIDVSSHWEGDDVAVKRDVPDEEIFPDFACDPLDLEPWPDEHELEVPTGTPVRSFPIPNPKIGDVWFSTVTNTLYLWTGSMWQSP